jgi:catechol 2,3-dioxygenase-like lactoylglutathione lyase family enzyme
MTVRRIVPDIRSTHLDTSRTFYVEVLGLEVAMDLGFIVTLASPSNPTAQISLMRGDDPSAIHPHVSIEVTDVDAVHARAVAQGLEIVYPLTDEAWGVRRFFVVDPDGTIINVLQHRDTTDTRSSEG